MKGRRGVDEFWLTDDQLITFDREDDMKGRRRGVRLLIDVVVSSYVVYGCVTIKTPVLRCQSCFPWKERTGGCSREFFQNDGVS